MKTQREWNEEFTRKMEASWAEVFVGIEENGNLHKFNKKSLREISKKERMKQREEDRAKKYARLLAFYQDEDNIRNERSPFEEDIL